MKDWLSKLKIGDKVILHRPMSNDIIKKVDKITKLYVVIENEKYKLSTGFLAGSGMWTTTLIREATKASLDCVRSDNVKLWLANHDFSNVSKETLYDFYFKVTKEEEK